MNKIIEKFSIGKPRGASNIARGENGELKGWHENGFIVQVNRSLDRRSVLLTISKGNLSYTEFMSFDSSGRYIGSDNASIPTDLASEIQTSGQKGFSWAQDTFQSPDMEASKIGNPFARKYCYAFAARGHDLGRYAPAGGEYYDSAYSAGDADGSMSKPRNTLLFRDMIFDNMVFNLKRGSVFLIASERESVMYVSGKNCTIRAYGDESLPPPIVIAAKSFPGNEFLADGAEFSRAISRSQTHTFDYVAYEDDPLNPLVRGTAVGALQSGQFIFSGGKLYVKDNPNPAGGPIRNLLISHARRVFGVTATGLVIDSVWWCGSSNHGLQASADLATQSFVGPLCRDTMSLYCGNNGIEVGEGSKKCNGSLFIRHADVGSRNNGINGSGDDGDTTCVECDVTGVIRQAGDSYGYSNDGITAHGTEGLARWVVVGCTTFNTKEDGIDIIGQTGGGVLHSSSVIAFNRVRKCGESGIFAWGQTPIVGCNDVGDTQWAPIQLGTTQTAPANSGGEVFSNYLYDGGKAANASGISIGTNGAVVSRNTMVRRSSAARSLIGFNFNMDTYASSAGTIEGNLLVTETDSAVVTTNTSSAANIKRFIWRNNFYVIPAANTVVPFATGGTPKSFATWRLEVEASARLSPTLYDAGIDAQHYAQRWSPLRFFGPVTSRQDFDGSTRSRVIGARFAS